MAGPRKTANYSTWPLFRTQPLYRQKINSPLTRNLLAVQRLEWFRKGLPVIFFPHFIRRYINRDKLFYNCGKAGKMVPFCRLYKFLSYRRFSKQRSINIFKGKNFKRLYFGRFLTQRVAEQSHFEGNFVYCIDKVKSSFLCNYNSSFQKAKWAHE